MATIKQGDGCGDAGGFALAFGRDPFQSRECVAREFLGRRFYLKSCSVLTSTGTTSARSFTTATRFDLI